MSSRRPPRAPGGGQRGPNRPTSGGDDSPAQTNLGLLLQRAMQAAQQTAPAAEEVRDEAEEKRQTQLCADCWNAITFKDEQGRHLARCAKNLWVKPYFTYEELNSNKVRRWYAICPEYDDSE